MTSGQSSVSVYNLTFDCGGNETSLSDCPTSPLDNCSDDASVFVKCPGNGLTPATLSYVLTSICLSNVDQYILY